MPPSYGKTFKELTAKDIAVMSDLTLTNTQVCEKVGITPGATLSRWRKKLEIKVPRGCKKGVSYDRSHFVKERVEYKCKRPDCNNTFKKLPSERKVYCSLSCSGFCNTGSGGVFKDTTPEYKRYSGQVHRLTNKIYEENKHLINPENHPRTVCGVDGGWQLDHIKSIRSGFDNGLPPEDIAKLENLQMLPWKQNLKKGK